VIRMDLPPVLAVHRTRSVVLVLGSRVSESTREDKLEEQINGGLQKSALGSFERTKMASEYAQ